MRLSLFLKPLVSLNDELLQPLKKTDGTTNNLQHLLKSRHIAKTPQI